MGVSILPSLVFYDTLNSVVKGVVKLITTELMHYIDFDINEDTNRYYNDEGKSVPRVTEIISSMIHSDRLMIWSNRLGMRGLKYEKELERAANFGTLAHSCIERYLKEKIKSESNIPFLGYLLWESVLKEKGIEVKPVLVEEKLSCKWFGGTLDAVLDISDKIYLIDFKTSNHVTFKYFLQLAAYIYLLSLNGIYPEGVIVLQLDKKSPGFNEYLLNFSVPEHKMFIDHCMQAFFSILFAYYNMKRVENEFTHIF